LFDRLVTPVQTGVNKLEFTSKYELVDINAMVSVVDALHINYGSNPKEAKKLTSS